MNLETQSDLRAGCSVAERYIALITAYCLRRDEDALSEAYDIAREALNAQLSLADFSTIHHRALASVLASAPASERVLASAEEFFLESIAVYDMAIRGFQSNVSRLQGEIAERRRVEEELRDITFDLARQRDNLDQQVQQRTAEIRDRAKTLEQTNRRLIQANREQADFTYALSHDLKTPINTIDMFLQTLLEDFETVIDAEAIELIGIASGTAARMKLMIDDVLQYARVVEHEFHIEPVALDYLVEEVVDELRDKISAVEAKVEIGPLPVVRGNPSQLRVLFLNLLSNAIKYRLANRSPVVRITAIEGPTGANGRITVSDNGIGMKPEQSGHIFDLFKRLHTYDEYEGSGIGLALCKRVADNHDTEIHVASQVGVGSSFGIDLEILGGDA